MMTEPVLDEDPEDYGDEQVEVIDEDEENDDPNYDRRNEARDGAEPLLGEFKEGPFSGKEPE